MIRQPDEDVDAWARAVIGAAIEVHSLLGPGLLEGLYEEALCTEMQIRRIPFARQLPVPMLYKGKEIGHGRLDVLVADALVIELKAVEALASVHVAQVLSYLRATGHQLGLLINFNVTALKQGGIKRVVLTQRSETNQTAISRANNQTIN
ncbi:MAG TPA: GxxExxY protein [Chloroflexia bacterium]|jgi:GxxExxY protein